MESLFIITVIAASFTAWNAKPRSRTLKRNWTCSHQSEKFIPLNKGTDEACKWRKICIDIANKAKSYSYIHALSDKLYYVNVYSNI